MAEVLIRQYANSESCSSASSELTLISAIVAGLALLAYDQVLTWEREVQCVWL